MGNYKFILGCNACGRRVGKVFKDTTKETMVQRANLAKRCLKKPQCLICPQCMSIRAIGYKIEELTT